MNFLRSKNNHSALYCDGLEVPDIEMRKLFVTEVAECRSKERSKESHSFYEAKTDVTIDCRFCLEKSVYYNTQFPGELAERLLHQS